jgi:hypothetical protein
MSDVLDDLIVLTDEKAAKKKACKGLVYRCRMTQYMDKNSCYVETVKMVPMKTLSCSGCEFCIWLHDFIREDIECNPQIWSDPENGELFEYCVTDQGTPDWETGCVEDFSCGFKKLEKKQ